MPTEQDVRITLPMFYLLLTLVDGESHGYAMGQEVAERSGGSVELGPASLYWTIGRLEESGLIRETDGPTAEEVDDGRAARRRYYELTDPGREVLHRETATWSRVLDFARSKDLGQEAD